MKKKEFIEEYIDEIKIIEILESLGSDADNVEYDDFVNIVNESCSKALDFYIESDGELGEISYGNLNDDMMHYILYRISR